MPELRRDPIGGQWVILTPERAARPSDFRSEPPPLAGKDSCPFCGGHEGATPPEILAYRDPGSGPNGPGWRVRVFPNKFPVLRVEGDLDQRGDGIYDVMNGVGAHEVIVESPEHVMSITALPEDRFIEFLRAYQERLQDLKRDRRLAYGLVFKNVGARAGATLEHTHSQIIVTPVVPIRVQNEMDRCRQYFDFRGRCLICDVVAQERQAGTRVALETANFVALEPYAARSPFETHVMPKTHLSQFESMDDRLRGEFAGILRRTLLKIERALGSPSYNYLIHTGPLNNGSLPHYHWHLEIIPRIAGVAGFEWGTGFFINSVPPEAAARHLREIRV